MSRGTLNGSHETISNQSLAECWSLDATGNWQKYLKDINGYGTWDLNQPRTSNNVNEITGIAESVGTSWATPAYNRAGNMTTIAQPDDLANSYAATYDAWNRLVKLEDGNNTIAEYQYDGVKRRVVVKLYESGALDETRHCYFTDPAKWQVIEERIGSFNASHVQHVWGLRYVDDLALRDRDTTGNGVLDERLYAMQDANWSVTAVADAVGGVPERFAYKPYGESEKLNPDFSPRMGSNLAWSVLYTGRELDLATGLQINRNRYLNLQLECWITRDPIGYADRPSLNQYLRERPDLSTDPLGLLRVTPKENPFQSPEPISTPTWREWWNNLSGTTKALYTAIASCAAGALAGISFDVIIRALSGKNICDIGILCSALGGCVAGFCIPLIISTGIFEPFGWLAAAEAIAACSVVGTLVCQKCAQNMGATSPCNVLYFCVLALLIRVWIYCMNSEYNHQD
ncbi:hypothetical protein DTL42_09720 [Bremerella cremea]|uniref:Uncharacterized protein n=1 Tax=Bremerella cremea TaxID=1031537 RepID=A0A368KV59_9BACT|nr:RHS repeat-associated core domain-containing protein [Bremerella cremea]RCS51938.1 hypothetical protein DTL42_09720 [Bremerella cremea]